MKITVAKIRKHNPCYDPLMIKGVTEQTELTLLQCMEFKGGSNIAKVWLATRFMTDLQNRMFAIWCARQCKTKIKEIKLYIDAIENYYIKKMITQEQLRAADWAAYRAADWAAYSAADSAVYNAADWAADNAADWAAYSAADSAVYNAADWAADNAAYRAAERKKQVKQIIKILKGSERNG